MAPNRLSWNFVWGFIYTGTVQLEMARQIDQVVRLFQPLIQRTRSPASPLTIFKSFFDFPAQNLTENTMKAWSAWFIWFFADFSGQFGGKFDEPNRQTVLWRFLKVLSTSLHRIWWRTWWKHDQHDLFGSLPILAADSVVNLTNPIARQCFDDF